MTPLRPRRRALPALAALLSLTTAAGASALAGAGPAAAAPDAAPAAARPAVTAFGDGDYVVVLAEPPAATYDGGTAGIARTRPAAGQQLDTRSPAVQQYRSHLAQQQDGLLRAQGITATHRYTTAVNGFAARLTARQAARLSADRSVLSVQPDSVRTATTTVTPEFLGLTGPKGVWAGLGGRDDAGTGVVVGVLDTGITPESPFFRGSPVTKRSGSAPGDAYRTSDGGIDVVKGDGGTFHGTCQAGPTFPASTCDSKLVSAQYFGKAFLAANPLPTISPYETRSPRDGNSHGTHTASTATGQSVADLTIQGHSFGRATGMAPAAKLSVYKVLWATGTGSGSGYTSDIVEGIDAAVSDGVDVINYSIGGSSPDGPADAVEIGFLNAAASGIFVAASAGNDGPGASTVDKNAPWVTSVAASTVHDFSGTVRLGNGTLLRGESLFSEAVPSTPAVLSEDVPAAGSSAADAGICRLGSLRPAAVKGKVVVCDRGTVDRVEKSAAVAQAGGAAMVLANVSEGELDADVHSVPTVHVDVTARAAIRQYFAGAYQPTIALLPGDQTGLPPVPVPVVAGFSSRGPAVVNGGDLLKPDITAPGVNILAGIAPGPSGGALFGPESGTSMSSPHVAGLAALVLQAHPRWSPMTIKSAMMTTATDTRNADGTVSHDPFAQGAGFVAPRSFLDPGLVYDSGVRDWIAFLEGVGIDTGTGVAPVDPSDFNSPSIAVGGLAGVQTVTRTVTAISPGTYRAAISVPGVRATVSPSVLTFDAAGQTRTFTVTLRRGTAPLDQYATGSLTWRGAGTSVRSPVAVRPVAVAAPAQVTGTGRSGSATFDVVPGSTGPLDLTLSGLVAGQVERGSVTPGDLVLSPSGNASNKVYRLQVPPGSPHARFDLVAADPSDDMDLFVVDPTFSRLVGVSASGSASERVDLVDPAPGNYYVIVNGFAAQDGRSASFTLRDFAVPDRSLGNASVSPDPVQGRSGQAAPVTVSWKGLAADRPYLGVVTYAGSDVQTVVAIG